MMNREIRVVRAVLILMFDVGAVGGRWRSCSGRQDGSHDSTPTVHHTGEFDDALYCTETVLTHLAAQDVDTQKDGKVLTARATAMIEKRRSKLRLQITAANVEVADEFQGVFPIVLQYRILNDDPGGLLAILDHSKVGRQVHVIALNRSRER
jgi:hypothetical protein